MLVNRPSSLYAKMRALVVIRDQLIKHLDYFIPAYPFVVCAHVRSSRFNKKPGKPRNRTLDHRMFTDRHRQVFTNLWNLGIREVSHG